LSSAAGGPWRRVYRASQVDEVVVLMAPPGFAAVGQWYRDFGQTRDEEVRELLEAAWQETD